VISWFQAFAFHKFNLYRCIEAVMRAHLGWLVVWGNIFGGAIGVASELAGY
jgi:hypothetical protein